MTTTGSSLPERLPCGRDVDELVEQVAEGHGDRLDSHQVQCPHCRAFLSEITTLWAPVVTMAGERVQPPAQLLAQVMTAVRELAAQVWHIVVPGERGVTRIAARVVGEIARAAAASVPGVRVVLGRSSAAPRAAAASTQATRAHRVPGTAVGIAGQRAVIDLAVATSYGLRIPDVAAGIRRRVLHDLRDLAGIRDAEVNIVVDNVIDDGIDPATEYTVQPVRQPLSSR